MTDTVVLKVRQAAVASVRCQCSARLHGVLDKRSTIADQSRLRLSLSVLYPDGLRTDATVTICGVIGVCVYSSRFCDLCKSACR